VARRGIIHVHSIFSYDGVHTLDELATFGRKCGYSFIGVTEHSDTFDHAKMALFVEECRRLSDEEFLVIAGIEFSCAGNLHLIGLGISQFSSEKDPVLLARFIRAQGGLAVVTHPSRYGYQIPPLLVGEIDGIEVWNASYDSRFVPDRRVIELWRRLRRDNGALTGFGGQDLHRITRSRHVTLAVAGNGELTADWLLGQLRERTFIVSNRYLRIGSERPPGWAWRSLMAWMWRGFLVVKWIHRRVSARDGG
jgi:predicted metal-dependent phosphoesterase TrpH